MHLHRSIHSTQSKKIISIDSSESSWFEIFLKDKKIGYLVDTLVPTKTGYMVKESLVLKVALLGFSEDVNMRVICDTDRKFLLKKFDLVLMADRIRFHITGMVKGKELVISRILRGKRIQYKIFLLSRPVLGISMFPFIRSKSIVVGQAFSIPFLDPTTMSQYEIRIRVARKERIRIKKMYYNSYRLETEIWGSPVVMWVDPDGRVLKQEGLMGLVLVRSSPQDAMANLASPDLYDVVSVQTNKSISNPRMLSYLKIRITGREYDNKIFEIRRAKLPDKSSYSIPCSDDKLSPYLVPEFNIESNSEAIVRKAKEIAGREKDPAKIVRKVVDWVYKNIEKRPMLSFPSALETLKSRVGDCNEHATLTAALFRALGIPSRICIGLIYNDGRFFYHAWNEVYVGKWIPVDSTLDQVPADAGHVLLFYGNVEKQMQLSRMVGGIKIEVLDFSYDKADRAYKDIQ